ncbi:MAG: O-antigen ligase family protein, partial [Oscillospiraceae bacterium]|nr:O-antigen ligase family protein [Oscillospiraceae bacterium]
MLFFMLFCLASESSFGALEAALLILMVMGFKLLRLNGKEFVCNSIKIYTSSKAFTAALFFYCAVDVLTVLYSSIPLVAVQKYKAECMLVLFFLAVSAYASINKSCKELMKTIAVAGAAVSVAAVLNLFVPVFPRVYFRRLSLRTDYNTFASVLFVSLVSGVFLHGFKSVNMLAGWCGWMGGCIRMTASRRTWLLLPLCGIFMLILFLCFRKDITWRKRWQKMTMLLAASSIVLSVVSVGIGKCMEYTAAGKSEAAGEVYAIERYRTLKENRENKRLILWSIAWEEYQDFTPTEKLFGKGAAYDVALYDTVNLDGIYPDAEKVRGKLSAHNFFLADLLNGGLIKAVAGICVWITLAVNLLRLFKYSQYKAWFYGMQLGFVFLNNSISNRFGFLYDRLFWIFSAMLCLELYT